jgi:hypothetical protein
VTGRREKNRENTAKKAGRSVHFYLFCSALLRDLFVRKEHPQLGTRGERPLSFEKILLARAVMSNTMLPQQKELSYTDQPLLARALDEFLSKDKSSATSPPPLRSKLYEVIVEEAEVRQCLTLLEKDT